jgi:hypothetical protein
MLDDIINSAWRDGEDPDLAVRQGRDTVTSILASSQPIDVRMGLLEAAIEPLLDAPGGNPMIVVYAAKQLMKDISFLERTTRVSAEKRLSRRVRITVMQARGLHCAGESYLAFRAALAGLTAVENFAEGREGLLAKMANRPPNAVAECAVALLGIAAASLRRAGIAQTSRDFWTTRICEIVERYIPQLQEPTSAYVYPGTPALIQVLYLLVERRDPADARLIRALHELDKVARPTDRRALATVPLREVAVAGYYGDEQRADEQSRLALPALVDSSLTRHVSVVTKMRYLREDDDGKEPGS